MEVIVDNETLDIREEPIMSFQVADISDIDQRQGDFSYEFDLPATQKNKRLLKRSHTIFGAPYQFIESWIRAGVDVRKGFIQVTQYDGGFKANFFSGNSNWIALIGDKMLSDLNLSALDHVYSRDNVVSSFSNTEGYIYPYMNVKSGPNREVYAGLINSQTITTDNVDWDDLSGEYFNEGLYESPYYTAGDDYTLSVYCALHITGFTGSSGVARIVKNDVTDIDSDSYSGTGTVVLRASVQMSEGDKLSIYIDTTGGDTTLSTSSFVRFTTSLSDLNNIEFTDLYPAIYVHTIIKRIFQEANFKLSGPFLNNADYKRMIMPFVGVSFSQSGEFVEGRSIYVSLVNPTTVTTEPVSWDKESSPQFNGGLYSAPLYTSNGDYTVSIEAAIGITSITASSITIEILKNGSEVLDTVTTSSVDVHILSDTELLTDGDTLQVFITSTGGDVTLSPANISYFKVITQEVIGEGDQVIASNILPEMRQIDLIKFVFVSYGVVPVVDDFSKVLTLTEFRSIKQKPPEDWSSKLAGKYEIDFYEFSHRYAKRNTFKYSDYEDEEELDKYTWRNDKGYGHGEIVLDNVYLTGESMIFENKFVPVWFDELPVNSKTANLSEFIRDNRPRVLFVVPDAHVSDFASFSEINIDGEVYPLTNIAWAYFTKYVLESDLDDFKTNLSYQMPNIINGNGNGLLSKYWQDYAGIMNRPKMIIAPFKLSIKDIINLDWTRRKLVTGENITGYYFLNRIRDYNFNSKIAQCELMLIDDLEIIDKVVLLEERATDSLQLENEDFYLLESGDNIKLE